MNIIKLPCYGIILVHSEGGWVLQSDLLCSPADSSRHEAEQNDRFNDMMQGIESMILGHARAGVDIESPAYIEGIETAVEGCANHTQ